MAIEVFADIWCPFAYVGLLMAKEERDASSNPKMPIIIRSWPLELVNGRPQDASATLHHANDLRTQVAPHLFAHIDISKFPTTSLPALALAARAYRVSAEVGERAGFALRHALFEEGVDISLASSLQRIASQCGVPQVEEQDKAQVLADWEEGKTRGVVGSPHFFHGSESMFCPALSISRDADARLHVSADQERLKAFISRCLGA